MIYVYIVHIYIYSPYRLYYIIIYKNNVFIISQFYFINTMQCYGVYSHSDLTVPDLNLPASCYLPGFVKYLINHEWQTYTTITLLSYYYHIIS